MTERSTQLCPKCGKAISVEAARPGQPNKTVHVDTGREECQ